MSSQLQEEVKKLKELYKTGSKVLENWPKSDYLSCCDDKTFVEVLEELTDVDLEAAVHGLQRQIEIENILVKNLERLSILNGADQEEWRLWEQDFILQVFASCELAAKAAIGECPGTNSKLISSQEQVARLRSRLLRCLSKQLNIKGHKESVLPPWHSRLENGEEMTTATTAETPKDTKPGPGSMRNGLSQNEVDSNQGDDSEADQQLYKSGSNTSGNSEQFGVDQVSVNNAELENLHWVEPRDFSSALSMSKDVKGKSCTAAVGNAKEKSPQKGASDKEVKPDIEVKGLKKIQETLEKNFHDKDLCERIRSFSNVGLDITPPPKPPPYSSREKKKIQVTRGIFHGIPLETILLQHLDITPIEIGCLQRCTVCLLHLKLSVVMLSLPDEDIPDGSINELPQIQNWDPTSLLEDLFVDKKDDEIKEEAAVVPQQPPSTSVVRMAGYMEKLPSSYKQKKSSVFKGWKKRHFKAFDGKLFYFEDHRNHEPLGMVDLKGCSVILSGERMLELVDIEGKAALKVRCATPAEAEDWKDAIEEEAKSGEVQDVENTDASPKEGSVIVIDLGSSSVKAGFASEEAWPQVVFPCVCAELKDDESDCVYGFGAMVPERRKNSILRFPLRRSLKIDKLKFSPAALTGVLEHVFGLLKVNPAKHKVIMTLPQNTSLNEKGELVEILLGFFGVEACYLQHQSILAMYSYSAVSGIIVDIGDHIDVIPVVEGCVIEAGASRLPYGGRQVTDMLTRLLTEQGHRFFSEVESYITRYIKEKACYVSDSTINNEEEDIPSPHTIDVMLNKYNIPGGTKKVTFDTARYRCTEGLFEPIVWGKDHPGIQELTYKAIMACSMDVRKQMCRSIYLSGGGSMLPGFAERLQSEVSALLPPHNIVQVHAGTDRHYAAFIGASVVANLPLFEQLCITQDEWNDIGADALEKWENL